jgi:hypothetical protein
MKEILNALKTAIPAGMTTLKGISVVPDPDWIPETAQFPYVGLKDGKVLRSEGAAETVDRTEEVWIYVYVRLLQNREASILGIDAPHPPDDIKGLLDYVADLHALLHLNTLSVSGVVHAFCPEETESETFMQRENVFIQRKGCRYVYENA